MHLLNGTDFNFPDTIFSGAVCVHVCGWVLELECRGWGKERVHGSHKIFLRTFGLGVPGWFSL